MPETRQGEYETPSIDSYILPNKIICSLIGLWPVDDDSSATFKAFAYFRLAFAFTAIGSIFVPQILEIAMNWGDLAVLTGVGCVVTTLGQLLFKMSYVVANRRRMTRVYREVREIWTLSDEPGDRSCFEELAYYAKIFTIGFYASGMCNAVTFAATALITSGEQTGDAGNGTVARQNLPFEVWYGPDRQFRSPAFELIFACHVVASFASCAGICGVDSTFLTLILHVCGQFKLIQVWIRNAGASVDELGANGLSTACGGIRNCIRHHQRVITLVNEMNELLGPILFVQILTSGLEICLSGYALREVSTVGDFLRFANYFVAMLVQLVMWCWPAEVLIEESQKVGHVAFHGVPWYDLPLACQRDVCFMIVRSQNYSRITAYTVQTISISTLTNVFNTAASYFTLLRQIQ